MGIYVNKLKFKKVTTINNEMMKPIKIPKPPILTRDLFFCFLFSMLSLKLKVSPNFLIKGIELIVKKEEVNKLITINSSKLKLKYGLFINL